MNRLAVSNQNNIENDPFNLERFVIAQMGVYPSALSEIQNGRKKGHWMWFVFPQLRGLGRSSLSSNFGLSGREEAMAYMGHKILGPRLTQISQALLENGNRPLHSIVSFPDDLKLLSCATLFDYVLESQNVFMIIIDQFFNGQKDTVTLHLISPI